MNQENDTQKKNASPEVENQEGQPARVSGDEPGTAEQNTPAGTENQAGAPAEETQNGKKDRQKKNSAKKYFQSAKFRHGSISTAFTAGFIAIVILLNVAVGLLSERFPSMNLDLTKNGVNTLAEETLKVVDGVKMPTKIYILADKDQVMSDSLYGSQGIQYSQVGNLAAKIAERNSNITVEYKDLDKNPAFAGDYKEDHLAAGDVLVKTEKRYRVLSVTDLFTTQYSRDYSSSQTYSNVNGALASALNAVISEKLPLVAFDTGHEEKLDASAYKKLLGNNSFDTKDVNLLTEEIPENTQMIVLGCPSTDYTKEEVEKLDAFLSNKKLAADRSLMVTFFPDQVNMPNLSNFLKEWGLNVPEQTLVAESSQQKVFMNSAFNIISDVQTDLKLNEKSSEYNLMLTPQASPINILYRSRGPRATYSLLKSSETSYLVDKNTKEGDNPEKASYTTAALSQETLKNGEKTYKANVVALGSTYMFADQFLNASTYGNGKFMLDLSKYATGTTNSATDVTILPQETNVADITLSAGQSNLIGMGIFMLLIPLAVAVCGIIVYRKRRNL